MLLYVFLQVMVRTLLFAAVLFLGLTLFEFLVRHVLGYAVLGIIVWAAVALFRRTGSRR